MKTSIIEEDGRLVMTFEGRLDTSVAARTGQEMKPLRECKGCSIVLDLTSLTYVSSSGLRLFLSLLQSARANGNSVEVKGLSDYMRSVFDETGFSRLFKLV